MIRGGPDSDDLAETLFFHFIPFTVIILNLRFLFSVCQVDIFKLQRRFNECIAVHFCNKIVRNPVKILDYSLALQKPKFTFGKKTHPERAPSRNLLTRWYCLYEISSFSYGILLALGLSPFVKVPLKLSRRS